MTEAQSHSLLRPKQHFFLREPEEIKVFLRLTSNSHTRYWPITECVCVCVWASCRACCLGNEIINIFLSLLTLLLLFLACKLRWLCVLFYSVVILKLQLDQTFMLHNTSALWEQNAMCVSVCVCVFIRSRSIRCESLHFFRESTCPGT